MVHTRHHTHSTGPWTWPTNLQQREPKVQASPGDRREANEQTDLAIVSGSTMTATADQRQQEAGRGKRKLLAGLAVGAVLVTGAILAGVLGSRAAQKPKRRPIQVEEMTYTMVTEGLLPAAKVNLPSTLEMLKQQNASGATASSGGSSSSVVTPVATPAPTIQTVGKTIGDWVTGGSSGGGGSSNSAVVLPEGAVVVPSWKQFMSDQVAANPGGRVVCYAKTGKEVIQQCSREFNSPCEVVILTNDIWTPYSIDHTINVSKPLLILGNPLRSPVLNCTNRIERLIDSE